MNIRLSLAGLIAVSLFATTAHATKVRFNGLSQPTGPDFEVVTQGYRFEFVQTPSPDQPTILPSPPSPHGSDSYALCGYCYATSSFDIYRDDNSQFDLAKMEIGAVGGLPLDDFDFTFTGYLSGGGTVVTTANVTVGGGVSIVTFDATWRDLASVNVSIDNSGNMPFVISTVDNIQLHQTPVITYANVPVDDATGPNTDPKPISMDGFILNGVEYDISINWNTSYDAVYTTPPLFEWPALAISLGAQDSADEIRYALLRDAYVPLPPLTNTFNGAFPLVPGAAAWGGYWGSAVELDAVGLPVNPALLYATNPAQNAVTADSLGWVRFTEVVPAQMVQSTTESNNVGGKIHPQHDGSAAAVGGLNDPLAVVVFGAVVAEDGYDFNASEIDPDSVRYGPAMAAQDPASTPDFGIDVDDDGNPDARFHFLTGDTGFACEDADALVTGQTVGGDQFESGSGITTDCDAQCH